MNICNLSFFHLTIWVRFPYDHLKTQIFILNNLFCLFIFLWFFTNFFLSILMVIISLELTRVNPDRNIFSINVKLTSALYTLQKFGLSPSPNFKAWIIISTYIYLPSTYSGFHMPVLFKNLYFSTNRKTNFIFSKLK